MSNNYLLDFSKFVNENYIRYEVEQALQEIVETVEVSWRHSLRFLLLCCDHAFLYYQILDYNGQLGQCKLELDKVGTRMSLNDRLCSTCRPRDTGDRLC